MDKNAFLLGTLAFTFRGLHTMAASAIVVQQDEKCKAR